MPDEPRWREDFPIEWDQDHAVTRREFTRFLVLTSLGLFVGNCWIALKRLFARHAPAPRVEVARLEEVPVGGVKLFRYPTANDPAILIRLDQRQLVAYSQKCPHLSCAVYFEAARGELVCPCHEGHFAASDGHVLAGPPTRPLPRIDLQIRGGRVYAIGRGEEA